MPSNLYPGNPEDSAMGDPFDVDAQHELATALPSITNREPIEHANAARNILADIETPPVRLDAKVGMDALEAAAAREALNQTISIPTTLRSVSSQGVLTIQTCIQSAYIAGYNAARKGSHGK